MITETLKAAKLLEDNEYYADAFSLLLMAAEAVGHEYLGIEEPGIAFRTTLRQVVAEMGFGTNQSLLIYYDESPESQEMRRLVDSIKSTEPDMGTLDSAKAHFDSVKVKCGLLNSLIDRANKVDDPGLGQKLQNLCISEVGHRKYDIERVFWKFFRNCRVHTCKFSKGFRLADSKLAPTLGGTEDCIELGVDWIQKISDGLRKMMKS